MIFYMGGKGFLKHYINEKPKKVLRTQYVIVSSSIRKTKRYEEQIIIANKYLYPIIPLITDYDNYDTNLEYQNFYKEYVAENFWFLAKVVQCAIKYDFDIVFLTSEKERKYYWFEIISELVLDRLGYPIIDYDDWRKGRVKDEFLYDPDEVLRLCKKEEKVAKEENYERIMNNEKLRSQYFAEMPKKRLLQELEKYGIIGFEDASREEIIEALEMYMN